MTEASAERRILYLFYVTSGWAGRTPETAVVCAQDPQHAKSFAIENWLGGLGEHRTREHLTVAIEARSAEGWLEDSLPPTVHEGVIWSSHE